MVVSLPLEVALQVVDVARFRRLDESAIEHLQRLTRIGLACKAFYGVVERTLRTTLFATLSSNPDKSFVDRTLAAEQAGTPFETLYLRCAGYTINIGPSLSAACGKDAIKRVSILRGNTLFLDSVNSDVLPALEVLQAYPTSLWGPITGAFLNLRELAVNFSDAHRDDAQLIQQLVSPSITPNLRILAIQDHVKWGATPINSLLDDVLVARLDFIQLDCDLKSLQPMHHLLNGSGPTPVLVCFNRGNGLSSLDAFGDDFRPPYVQLQALQLPLFEDAFDVVQFVAPIIACLETGGAKKALFLPQELHASTFVEDPLSSRVRDRLLTIVDEHEVEYVGWYYADEETDASISEPFRRYLNRERLEGRM